MTPRRTRTQVAADKALVESLRAAADVTRHVVETPQGPAHVRVLRPESTPHGTVLLGHGSGGSRDMADLLALARVVEHGWTVGLVDQPWRVAGRKVATAPPTLDRAWRAVLDTVAADGWDPADTSEVELPHPWVLGGRSAGARVACRTSVDPLGQPVPGILGVICLAFPLHPTNRPHRSRGLELANPLRAHLPTLVVQGDRDPFGTPEEIREAMSPGTAVDQEAASYLHLREVPASHSPTRDLDAVTAAAVAFLDELHTTRSGTDQDHESR